jgi:hypothetical protein
MSEAKFTPGPWLAEKIGKWGVYSDDATGSIVAQCGGFKFAPRPEVEQEANAHLIAAAPEMYEAIVAFLRSDGADMFGIVGYDADGHPLNAAGVARKMMRESIAKAEGRQ